MGKAPKPAKPNLPKQEVSPVISQNPAPAMPFGGRVGIDENRANMAAQLLNQTGRQPQGSMPFRY